MTASLCRLLASDAPAAVLLIRLLVGAVFVSEGIQKFLFPADLGVGRFTKIGMPSPEVLAPFVGVVEIVGGLLLLLGLLTRLAALALLVDMLVAIATTKLPHPAQRWLLEDGARGAHRLVHAPRRTVSAPRRRGGVVARCPAHKSRFTQQHKGETLWIAPNGRPQR